jgi:hypothetical protein
MKGVPFIEPEDPVPKEELVRRGQQAANLLGSEEFREVIARLGRRYIRAWLGTPAEDAAGRENIWMQVRALALIQTDLTAIVDRGKVQAEQERKAAERDVSSSGDADQ